MHEETVTAEFTQQAESLNSAAVARAAEVVDGLVRLAAPQPHQRWLDVACGPGIVTRGLAAQVRAVHGVDVTPAMVALARREAAAAGLSNVSFAVADATALDVDTASVDGVVARFALHHMPVPGRLLEEAARIVHPGGCVVLADHIADAAAEAAAWSQEIERLRDPSHWACLPVSRLRALGRKAGLELEDETIVPIELDFDDWLRRGSTGPGARTLIERALAERPATAECFRVVEDEDRGRILRLRVWMARWRR
jgi:SAM-dependent methyltransferase